MQRVDPRILYVLLVVIITVSLVDKSFSLPIIPAQQTVQAYNTIEAAGRENPRRMAIVDGWWSASTQGENKWQTIALMTQLMRDRIPFAMLSGDPQNTTLMETIADKLAQKYNYKYGQDYVNWGYKVAYPQTLIGMVQDIPGTLKEDANGTPMAKLPVMNGVHTFKDISVVAEITPVSSLDLWLGMVQGVDHTPIVYLPTAVMAPEAFPYLDSHQISGMAIGIKGAGDYEKLLGMKSTGTQISSAMSLVYALIILLIVVGNIGYWADRAVKAQQAK